MLRQFSTRRIVGFAILDWIVTLACLLCAAYVRLWVGDLPAPIVTAIQELSIPINLWPITTPTETVLWPVFVLVSIIWPFFFVVFHVYDGRHNGTLREEMLNVFLAIVASMLTLAGLLYFTYQETSRIAFIVFLVLDVLILLGMRVGWWLVRRRRDRPGRVSPTLIAGAGSVGRRVVNEFTKYSPDRIRLVGYADDDPQKQGQVINELPVLGTLDDLNQLAAEWGIRDVVVALPLDAHSRLVDTCRCLQGAGIHVHVIPDLFSLSFPSATLDGFGGIPVVYLGQPGIHGWPRIFKRIFDVIITSLLLLFIWPAMLIVALCVKLDSPGPILYRQKRLGENGYPFHMLKFRSMFVDNNEQVHQQHVTRLITENISPLAHGSQNGSAKIIKDPRITRVGRFIRSTSLDELPQLFNVLTGEMSLVGPRPPIPYEADLYEEWHRQRLDTLPGVTGVWQVHGRNRVSFDEMVRMDIEYIERQSLWLDLKLVLQTPLAMVTGRGAG